MQKDDAILANLLALGPVTKCCIQRQPLAILVFQLGLKGLITFLVTISAEGARLVPASRRSSRAKALLTWPVDHDLSSDGGLVSVECHLSPPLEQQ